MKETGVRPDGWCEGDLGQQWRLRERSERGFICNSMSLLGPVFFWTTLPCSGCYHPERGGMPLQYEAGINCIEGAILKIKAQMSSIWAKGCMLMIVLVLSDLS